MAGGIARFKGQFDDCLAADGVAECGVGGVELFGGGFNRDRVADGTKLESDWDGCGSIDQEGDPFNQLDGEASGLNGETVGAGLQLGERVGSTALGEGGAFDPKNGISTPQASPGMSTFGSLHC